ncbi:MAG: hypothetical protein KIT16_04095 [Rhodospirillaceae bacterium]|nr:hypothetical protein [Rhodospirillaceae bacterium]
MEQQDFLVGDLRAFVHGRFLVAGGDAPGVFVYPQLLSMAPMRGATPIGLRGERKEEPSRGAGAHFIVSMFTVVKLLPSATSASPRG